MFAWLMVIGIEYFLRYFDVTQHATSLFFVIPIIHHSKGGAYLT